jgi:hypothetical protein
MPDLELILQPELGHAARIIPDCTIGLVAADCRDRIDSVTLQSSLPIRMFGAPFFSRVLSIGEAYAFDA